ncbi:hypothetical protein IJS77_05685 [bacterium]|nr:hypothetical protein [bacterium]
MKKIIGFWGYLPPNVVKEYKQKYPEYEWVDLDLNYNAPAQNILPDSNCKIMKNIIDNSFANKENLEVILAPIGKDKCDNAYFASKILKEYGFNVIQLNFENLKNRKPTPICFSNLPLRDKINLITSSVIVPVAENFEYCEPKFAFWGVPPNDFSILDLFPKETHVLGWTRCVEAGVPADLELECEVYENVPTVFFAQSFCSKNQLAKYLANKYNGLYIDVDDIASNSVFAKVEAFLRLR